MQSGVAGTAWNGHDSGDGMDPMDTRYDNPGVKDIFAEPSGRPPRGPLELVRKPEVVVDGALPTAAAEVASAYVAGRLDGDDPKDRVKPLRLSGRSLSP